MAERNFEGANNKQWSQLIPILDDDRVEIDNNLIKNRNQGSCVRFQKLFVRRDEAGRIALMYSILGSFKVNKIAFEWLKDALDRIIDTKLLGLESLLPGNRA